MPFVFAISGILLIIAGVRGKTSDLMTLVKSDFTGQPNYFEWMIALFLVGAIGYIKELSTISKMFMFLVLAGLLWKNKQVLSEFHAQETQTVAASTKTTASNPFTPAGSQPSNSPNLLGENAFTSINQSGEAIDYPTTSTTPYAGTINNPADMGTLG
jgi:hypothetical protein